MKTVSIFSGCGGMDLGAKKAGAEIIFANDIMPEAARCFENYFPDVEFKLADISDITDFPSAELVIGGYPCQSFSMGGNRNPKKDKRTLLYQEFAKCLNTNKPKFFIAENVSGLKALESGKWLRDQLKLFDKCGKNGYNLSFKAVRAEIYGLPQRRKRLFIVGVSKDIGLFYKFPVQTHGSQKEVKRFGLKPYTSHGDVISGLPLWPIGEFYERPHDPESQWPWYYMSRNRKAKWDNPSYTIVANYRHTPLNPASPRMKLEWSNLKDGWKQKWVFTNEYEHTVGHPGRQKLEKPRRLSWRECALLQTFPPNFEPSGNLEKKFKQIGNAVPPRLAEIILSPLIDGSGLFDAPCKSESADIFLCG